MKAVDAHLLAVALGHAAGLVELSSKTGTPAAVVSGPWILVFDPTRTRFDAVSVHAPRIEIEEVVGFAEMVGGRN